MDLGAAHIAFLRLVAELDAAKIEPRTRALGTRFLESTDAFETGGSPRTSAPWHGTDPIATELRDAGCIELCVARREFHDWTEAYTVDEYAVTLTDAGRNALAEPGGA